MLHNFITAFIFLVKEYHLLVNTMTIISIIYYIINTQFAKWWCKNHASLKILAGDSPAIIRFVPLIIKWPR